MNTRILFFGFGSYFHGWMHNDMTKRSEEKTQPAAVLQAVQLEKRYSNFVAIHVDELQVYAGECFGFLGPNGAGKSSLMRMIYGRSPISSGTLHIFGFDAAREMRAIKAQIGVVPQEDNLDPDFTVLENLIVYATYFDIPTRVARRRAEQLLSFFQLEEKAHVHVDKLSGGMRRRLMIARSLINEPKLIILDEPTTGLDPQARHVVWSGLRELKQQGITLLLTTHYMEEAAQLCDRLLMLDRGKELSRGTPDELIARHAGGGVVELWYVDAARRQYLLDSLQGEEGVRKWEISGELLLIFCDSFSVAEQLGKRLYQSLPPQAMARYRPANLEDVFLSLAGRGIDVEGAQ